MGILFFIAEEEGDVLIIERHCSMELDVGCEFDDDEEPRTAHPSAVNDIRGNLEPFVMAKYF